MLTRGLQQELAFILNQKWLETNGGELLMIRRPYHRVYHDLQCMAYLWTLVLPSHAHQHLLYLPASVSWESIAQRCVDAHFQPVAVQIEGAIPCSACLSTSIFESLRVREELRNSVKCLGDPKRSRAASFREVLVKAVAHQSR